MRALTWLALLILAGCAAPFSAASLDSRSSRAPAGSPEPAQPSLFPTLSPLERGRALFLDKGCVSCHTNTRVKGHTVATVGPDLTRYHQSPAFLAQWLADPPAVKPGTQMPNLHLTPGEIADLVAFLNGPG